VLALVALLVLVAVPLYLWRHPRPLPPQAAQLVAPLDAGPADAATAAAPDAGNGSKLALSQGKMVRCSAKRGTRPLKEHCDDLPFFEDALARSIRENLACAPPTASAFTVSFVLTVDFDRKKMHLWAGQSGTLKRRAASDLIHCVEHALPAPDWATTPHQFSKYDVNVLASYPGAGGIPANKATPVPLGGP
jgi:hypothetical protein